MYALTIIVQSNPSLLEQASWVAAVVAALAAVATLVLMLQARTKQRSTYPSDPPVKLSRMRAATRMEVLSLCVNRGGYRRGRRVAQFIAEWELAVRSMGREITAEEFASWWKDGNATAYRRLAEFRALFPELGARGKPDDLMRPLLTHLAIGHLAPVERDIPLEVPT